MVMNQTPSTRLVCRLLTTWGRPTTIMLESSVAMKMPTVVTVRTTHLYSKNESPIYRASPRSRSAEYKTPQQREQDIPAINLYPETRPEQALIRNLGEGSHRAPYSRTMGPLQLLLETTDSPVLRDKPVISPRTVRDSETPPP